MSTPAERTDNQTEPTPIPPVPGDVRLVVTDMDGTLLDGDKRIPPSLWPLLDELDARESVFAPASGRQAATLQHQLDHATDPGHDHDATPGGRGIVVIAENGGVVARGDELLDVTTLDPAVAPAVVRRARELADGARGPRRDLGVVLCAADRAYVERDDQKFLEQVVPYYASRAVVPDLLDVEGPFVKVAVYDFGGVEESTAPALAELDGAMTVVVSGEHWVDVMTPGVDKAVAVRAVQAKLGITPAQTMVFGDYLNDLGMLATADWSYAVANAHPAILEAARYVAPSNTENGVVRTVRAALGLPDLDPAA